MRTTAPGLSGTNPTPAFPAQETSKTQRAPRGRSEQRKKRTAAAVPRYKSLGLCLMRCCICSTSPALQRFWMATPKSTKSTGARRAVGKLRVFLHRFQLNGPSCSIHQLPTSRSKVPMWSWLQPPAHCTAEIQQDPTELRSSPSMYTKNSKPSKAC